MTAADRVIRWSTALAVVGVAAVAAVVSYEHASALVREHGESGWTGHLIPLTVDGLIYASSICATKRSFIYPLSGERLEVRISRSDG